jgi:glycerol kinase
MKYILSIDQSTSATKAILFDTAARPVHAESVGHKQHYPCPGWVEHDPDEIYANTLSVIRHCVENSRIQRNDIAGLAITNQRETAIVWDRNNGRPVCNAIVWQCNRGAALCEALRDRGLGASIREKTGLIIDPYFSASGIAWVLDELPGARQKARNGALLYGTVDSWLLWKLTGGQVHATDPSNASRTMLYNLNSRSWDEDIHRELNIPISMAPSIVQSDEIAGYTDAEGFFEHPIPVSGIMGDSHAALFGQMCFQRGMAKVTYGTGSSVMLNIGEHPWPAPAGLVTSVGFSLRSSTSYAFEGNIHCTGATIKWLQEKLGLFGDPGETEELARSVPDNGGVYFVPAFAGLAAPYWDNRARALICGMTLGTDKGHIVRAALESVAYQVKDLIDVMTAHSGIPLLGLRADGGATRNNFLMQFQADVLQGPVSRSPVREASALGAALACGIAVGIWKGPEDLDRLRNQAVTIAPVMPVAEAESLYAGWSQAVKRTQFN